MLAKVKLVNALRVSGRERYATRPSAVTLGTSSKDREVRGGKGGIDGLLLKMLSSNKERFDSFTRRKVNKDESTCTNVAGSTKRLDSSRISKCRHIRD